MIVIDNWLDADVPLGRPRLDTSMPFAPLAAVTGSRRPQPIQPPEIQLENRHQHLLQRACIPKHAMYTFAQLYNRNPFAKNPAQPSPTLTVKDYSNHRIAHMQDQGARRMMLDQQIDTLLCSLASAQNHADDQYRARSASLDTVSPEPEAQFESDLPMRQLRQLLPRVDGSSSLSGSREYDALHKRWPLLSRRLHKHLFYHVRPWSMLECVSHVLAGSRVYQDHLRWMLVQHFKLYPNDLAWIASQTVLDYAGNGIFLHAAADQILDLLWNSVDDIVAPELLAIIGQMFNVRFLVWEANLQPTTWRLFPDYDTLHGDHVPIYGLICEDAATSSFTHLRYVE